MSDAPDTPDTPDDDAPAAAPAFRLFVRNPFPRGEGYGAHEAGEFIEDAAEVKAIVGTPDNPGPHEGHVLRVPAQPPKPRRGAEAPEVHPDPEAVAEFMPPAPSTSKRVKAPK